MSIQGVGTSSAAASDAASYPTPKQGGWVARGFRFHTGQVLPELKAAHTAVGKPGDEPVLVLHRTTGTAANMLTPTFASELFDPGKPLYAARHFIISTDSLGSGQSAKPSDGLRAAFPLHNCDDLVEAQHRLLKGYLGVRHVRVVIGNSMGGTHT